MPEVTITFQEAGQAAASFTIPDYAVAALQQFVDASPETYTGKADLFRQWALKELIKPLCQRYNSYPPELMTLLGQKVALDQQVATAIEAAISAAVAAPTP